MLERQRIVVDILGRLVREDDLEVPSGVGRTPDHVLVIADFPRERRAGVVDDILRLVRADAVLLQVQEVLLIPLEEHAGYQYT